MRTRFNKLDTTRSPAAPIMAAVSRQRPRVLDEAAKSNPFSRASPSTSSPRRTIPRDEHIYVSFRCQLWCSLKLAGRAAIFKFSQVGFRVRIDHWAMLCTYLLGRGRSSFRSSLTCRRYSVTADCKTEICLMKIMLKSKIVHSVKNIMQCVKLFGRAPTFLYFTVIQYRADRS